MHEHGMACEQGVASSTADFSMFAPKINHKREDFGDHNSQHELFDSHTVDGENLAPPCIPHIPIIAIFGGIQSDARFPASVGLGFWA